MFSTYENNFPRYSPKNFYNIFLFELMSHGLFSTLKLRINVMLFFY